MRISYDGEIDALYVRFVEGKQECRTVRLNEEVALNIVPCKKAPAGIEILDAKEVLGSVKSRRSCLRELPHPWCHCACERSWRRNAASNSPRPGNCGSGPRHRGGQVRHSSLRKRGMSFRGDFEHIPRLRVGLGYGGNTRFPGSPCRPLGPAP